MTPTPLLPSCSLLRLIVALLASTSASPSSDCAGPVGSGACPEGGSGSGNDGDCLDAPAFLRRIASASEDESLLPSLRGTFDDVYPREEIDSLVDSLPAKDFVSASGYDEDDGRRRDGRAYHAPQGYAGLGLRDLSASDEVRYATLLKLREASRRATERTLGLCPGTLFVEYTTVSQKTAGGAHRAHADNCLHYFDDDGKGGLRARCNATREHPYPHRVAASILYLNDCDSGNFAKGEFYFAKPDGEVGRKVPVERGRIVCFTGGVEGLHGALPVKRRADDGADSDAEPRRLALAMWYVVDPKLEEYIPAFQKQTMQSTDNGVNDRAKPRKRHDPNDPYAPNELFVLPIPNVIGANALLTSLGERLASDAKRNPVWKLLRDGSDRLLLLFEDNTAMISLEFNVALDEPSKYAQSGVLVERHTEGRTPASLRYLLQESVMLHSVLDAMAESTKAGSEGSNDVNTEKEEGRRYVAEELARARETLPARRA
ncbi:hypothetical protein ACHAWF_014349 [Thalassiosira exigua]